MNLRIDHDSSVPIYIQIVEAIKHQVATKRLKPGQPLPTVRDLAARLQINPNTVARAYEQLDSDTVITTQQGRGTRVRERPDDAYLSRVRELQLRLLVDGAVGHALAQGYTIDEIRDTCDAQLTSWMEKIKSKV